MRRCLSLSLAVAILLSFSLAAATSSSFPFDEQRTVAEAKVYRSSDHFDTDYVELTIMDDAMIRIEGKSSFAGMRFGVFCGVEKPRARLTTGCVGSDGHYYGVFSAMTILHDGIHQMRVGFTETRDASVYQGYYTNIRLRCEAGGLSFVQSPVYDINRAAVMSNSQLRPEEHLDLSLADEAAKQEIKELAGLIVAGASTDYERLLRIHDWVAENIYYDKDSYRAGQPRAKDAYGTLSNRKSTCTGYSNLAAALLRSIGIPSRVIRGHALGTSAAGKYWDEVDHSEPNHSWNEAFVDGRWVILDTTRDSANKYEYGQFRQGRAKHAYFDPSLQAFSHSHKIMQ